MIRTQIQKWIPTILIIFLPSAYFQYPFMYYRQEVPVPLVYRQEVPVPLLYREHVPLPMPYPVPVLLPNKEASTTTTTTTSKPLAFAYPVPVPVPFPAPQYAIPAYPPPLVCANKTRAPGCPPCPPCLCFPSCTPSFFSYCSLCHQKCRCKSPADAPVPKPPLPPRSLPQSPLAMPVQAAAYSYQAPSPYMMPFPSPQFG